MGPTDSDQELADLVVEHEMKGVTAAMIDWWWDHMGPTEVYKLWEPHDHLSFEWQVSPEENGHVGAIQMIWEYIGKRIYGIRIRWDDPATSPIPTIYSHKLVASTLAEDDRPIGRLVHEWEDIAGGVRVRSTFLMPAGIGQQFFEDLRAHNLSEMNNFPRFLPRLFKEATGG